MPKITLTQSNPDAPTFMTICANPISKKEEIYSALIHSFGDISEDGEKCQSFGPHYNPFGVKKIQKKINLGGGGSINYVTHSEMEKNERERRSFTFSSIRESGSYFWGFFIHERE